MVIILSRLNFQQTFSNSKHAVDEKLNMGVGESITMIPMNEIKGNGSTFDRTRISMSSRDHLKSDNQGGHLHDTFARGLEGFEPFLGVLGFSSRADEYVLERETSHRYLIAICFSIAQLVF